MLSSESGWVIKKVARTLLSLNKVRSLNHSLTDLSSKDREIPGYLFTSLVQDKSSVQSIITRIFSIESRSLLTGKLLLLFAINSLVSSFSEIILTSCLCKSIFQKPNLIDFFTYIKASN